MTVSSEDLGLELSNLEVDSRRWMMRKKLLTQGSPEASRCPERHAFPEQTLRQAVSATEGRLGNTSISFLSKGHNDLTRLHGAGQ